jgi:hypothetical protein
VATDLGALAWLRWLLAPDGDALATGDGGSTPVERYRVLPSGRHPRVVVPVTHPAATRAVLESDLGSHGLARRLTGAFSRLGRLPPGVGAGLLVSAGGRPAAPTLARWLADRLDRPDLQVGVTIGAPRPNRKPVLKLVSPDGSVIAFAKIGWNPLTTALVRNERHWLERVASERPAGLTVPTVWLTDTWKGMDVLITHPLVEPATSSPFVVDAALVATIADLAPGGDHDLADSLWWKTTAERVAAVDDTAVGRRLGTACAALASRMVGTTWRFGAWHGDLTGWNARAVPDGVTVWDWERASGPVPVGFDAAHAAFRSAEVDRRLGVAAAADAAEPVVADVLRSIGLPPTHAPDLVTWYLLERSLRWYEDRRLGSSTATPDRQRAITRAVTARATSRTDAP